MQLNIEDPMTELHFEGTDLLVRVLK